MLHLNQPDHEKMEKLIKDIDKNQYPLKVFVTHDDVKWLWNEVKSFYQVKKAAGGIVTNKKGELLMIKRANRWELPKGHLENNESLEECAIRETEEETGIGGLKVEHFVTKTRHTYHLKNKNILKITHWYKMKTKDNSTPVPATGENILKAKWVKPEEFEKFLGKTYPVIEKMVRKELELDPV